MNTSCMDKQIHIIELSQTEFNTLRLLLFHKRGRVEECKLLKMYLVIINGPWYEHRTHLWSCECVEKAGMHEIALLTCVRSHVFNEKIIINTEKEICFVWTSSWYVFSAVGISMFLC